jgi:hypothetical protein
MPDELIIGATSPTYTLTPTDVGRHLYCKVRATNVAGFAIATAIAVGPIVANLPTNSVAPVASSFAPLAEGVAVSCTTGTWAGTAPITLSYQWVRYTVGAIGGATASTYVLTAADVGFFVFCQVTATNVAGSLTVSSNTLGPVPGAGVAPSVTTAPSIADTTPSEAEGLVCDPGVWDGDATITFSYEWHKTTAAVGVPPSLVTAPEVSPEPATEGVDLVCTTGTWSGDPTITFSYEWHRVDVPTGSGVTGQPVGLLLTITKP